MCRDEHSIVTIEMSNSLYMSDVFRMATWLDDKRCVWSGVT